jgi:hypothetical protein
MIFVTTGIAKYDLTPRTHEIVLPVMASYQTACHTICSFFRMTLPELYREGRPVSSIEFDGAFKLPYE